MKQAYVTLLSSKDYLCGVLILNRNLKKLKCQFPLIVLITEDIYNEVVIYLEKEQIQYKKVPVILYPTEVHSYYPEAPWLKNTASKLNIFNLDDYDKIVYIDTDSYFFKSIDELFNYPDGAMYESSGFEGQAGFSGLFVCCPRYHNFNFYYTIMTKYKLLDGTLFSELWFPYYTNIDYHISSKYFHAITEKNLDTFAPIGENIYGIHFCSIIKPWHYLNVEKYLEELNSKKINLGILAIKIIKIYFDKYLLPLIKDYPELSSWS